jgi:undecaprenyl-diphosphatase
MEKVLKWDENLSVVINQFHFFWLDTVLVLWSEKWIWIPLYGYIVFLLFKNLDKKRFIISVLLIIIAIALSDLTASGLLKPLFQRLRPCHDPNIRFLLNLPAGCGGLYGFASSHAANSFCFATFSYLILRNKIPSIGFLFFWALVTGWSRIYLGAHFVGDILVGFLIGLLWALLVFFVFRNVESSPHLESKF